MRFLYLKLSLKRLGLKYWKNWKDWKNWSVLYGALKLSFNFIIFLFHSVNLNYFQKTYRSSLSNIFFKIGALKYFAKCTGKHQCWGLFFNEAAGLRPTTLLKRDSGIGVFPANFSKFLRFVLIEHLWWLLLNLMCFILFFPFTNLAMYSVKIFIKISSGNPFKVNFFDSIETSPLICSANQLMSFNNGKFNII